MKNWQKYTLIVVVIIVLIIIARKIMATPKTSTNNGVSTTSNPISTTNSGIGYNSNVGSGEGTINTQKLNPILNPNIPYLKCINGGGRWIGSQSKGFCSNNPIL